MKQKRNILFLCLFFILFLFSCFLFKNKNKELGVFIDSNEEYNITDFLAFSLDDVKQEGINFPKSLDGYVFDSDPLKSYCDNASISFDPIKWKLEIYNVTGVVKCNINFKSSDAQIYAYTIDGVKEKGDFPKKDSNYYMASASCSNGVKADVDNSSWSIKVYSDKPTSCIINFKTKATNPTFSQKILEDNPNVGVRYKFYTYGNFLNESGLFVENRKGYTENDKPVYYFSGDVNNNYVKFGKDKKNRDLYWRIIRINEDGGVRLLYAGAEHAYDAGYIVKDQISTQEDTNSIWDLLKYNYNNLYNTSKYVGWKYANDSNEDQQHGNDISSPIKTIVDYWYYENLITDYDGYISRNAIYCNDRTTPNNDFSLNGSTFNYGALSRLSYVTYLDDGSWVNNKNEPNPQFKCPDIRDSFSVLNDKAKLDLPVGLITADEVVYAGSMYWQPNNKYYIKQNMGPNVMWTMSPSMWWGYNNHGYQFDVYMNGHICGDGDIAWNGPGIRPVISLKPCVLYLGGDGSAYSPYIVKVDSVCGSNNNI